MNLTKLADECGSDKGTVHMHPHKYTYLYDLVFYPLRDAAITFVEMGLAVGGPEVGRPADRQATSPSVRMWQQYFSRAQIVGFDISDFSHQENERFRFVRGAPVRLPTCCAWPRPRQASMSSSTMPRMPPTTSNWR